MASTYETQANGQGRTARKPKGNKPVTAHPLFPAIVALWFGALFSLGSLAIRPALLESVVLSAHIDTVIPAAAPPLGITARILLALGLGAFGAVLGVVIARRLARPTPEVRPRKRGAKADEPTIAARSRDAHPDAPARRPILAHEELGADDFDQAAASGAQPIAGRRRALAIEDTGPRDYHDLAPLPGGAPQILDLGQFGGQFALPTEPAESESGALDLAAFAPPPSPAETPATPVVLAPPPVLEGASLTSVRLGPAQPDGTPVAFDPDLPRTPEVVELPVVKVEHPGLIFDLASTSQRLFERPADDDQPLTNLVIAPVDDDAPEAEAPAPQAESAPPPQAFAQAPQAVAQAPQVFSLPEGNAAERISAAALGILSHVELIERLALSLQRRRDLDGTEDTAPAAPCEPEVQAPLAPVSASEPPPAPPLPVLPAVLRPISFAAFDADHVEDLASLVPPRHLIMPEAKPAADEPAVLALDIGQMADEEDVSDTDDSSDDDDDGYSSLLDLKPLGAPPRPTPPMQNFVRIEEPEPAAEGIEPVVIFPGRSARQAPFSAPSQGAMTAPAAVAEPAATAPAAAETPAATETVAHLRRFDAPGSSGVPGPTMTEPAVPLHDPEETERALRAALASLQRMSGAA